MKTRKIIVEIICFVLIMYWFYEGIYKVAYLHAFGFYIKHAALPRPLTGALKYMIPLGEVGTALLLLFPKYRITALYATIGLLMIYVLWIMCVYLFTNRVFWPFHALWAKPSWMQKMLISLALSWMSLVAIFLPKKWGVTRSDNTKVLGT